MIAGANMPTPLAADLPVTIAPGILRIPRLAQNFMNTRQKLVTSRQSSEDAGTTVMTREKMIQGIRNELLGRYFSTRSELRQMAERAGFDYIPVEFLSLEGDSALTVLRPKGIGEIRVAATRPVAWQRYCITEVAYR